MTRHGRSLPSEKGMDSLPLRHVEVPQISSGLPDPWASPRPRRSAVSWWIPPEPVVIVPGIGVRPWEIWWRWIWRQRVSDWTIEKKLNFLGLRAPVGSSVIILPGGQFGFPIWWNVFQAFVYHERRDAREFSTRIEWGVFKEFSLTLVSQRFPWFRNHRHLPFFPSPSFKHWTQLCSKRMDQICTTHYPNQVSLEKGRKTSIYGQTQPTSWSQASSSHSAVTNHSSAHQLVAWREPETICLAFSEDVFWFCGMFTVTKSLGFRGCLCWLLRLGTPTYVWSWLDWNSIARITNKAHQSTTPVVDKRLETNWELTKSCCWIPWFEGTLRIRKIDY